MKIFWRNIKNILTKYWKYFDKILKMFYQFFSEVSIEDQLANDPEKELKLSVY
jgi:hypothetical protein